MSDWKTLALQKRQQQAASIPPAWRLPTWPSPPQDFTSALHYIHSCPLLSPTELSLTETTDGKALQAQLLSGAVSAEAVITAFSKRAALAQQLVGCCTEMFFEAAIQRARWLDGEFERRKGPVGPLHGMPVSVKDLFDVEGVDSTIGWVGLIGKPAKRNSVAVELLLELGAILYVKTNVPQSMMMSDSYNHIFKQSVNSLNRNFISGGSSGGEAALIGARGSIIGIGTDIGGSIRIPAVLQGLYGLCPTIGRVPNDSSTRTQKYIVPPVAGPIASSLSSIELYMESLLTLEPWNIDPHLLPIPWRTTLAEPPKRSLKIAFIYDDGLVKPQPPVERAARHVASKLQKAGHEVVEWKANSHVEAYQMWLEAVLADGGEECRELCLIANEPLVQGMLVGKPENLLSASERRNLEERKNAYLRSYLKRWKESGIDALIMPVLPWVSFRPKTWVKSKQLVSYTSHWNFVNYAALTIPAIVVDPVLDQPNDQWRNHVARNESDHFNHDQCGYLLHEHPCIRVLTPLDDVELVKGMPVGLQIVGGRFGEEKVVAIAKVIRELLDPS